MTELEGRGKGRNVNARDVSRAGKLVKVYDARARDEFGSYKSFRADTKQEAQDWKARMEAKARDRRRAQRAHDDGMPLPCHYSLGELAEKFIKWGEGEDGSAPSRSPATSRRYRSCLATLPQVLKDKRADRVMPHDLEAFKMVYSRTGVSKRSVNISLLFVSAVYSWAARQGIVKENPVFRVSKYRYEAPPPRVLSDAEIKILYDAANPFQKAVLTLGLGCAMRAGEITRIKFSDLDFERGILTVTESKTGRSHQVLMPEAVKALLTRLKTVFITPGGIETARTRWQKEYVFGTQDGGSYRVRRHAVTKSMGELAKKSGIKEFHAHVMRHTAATTAIRAGASEFRVQALLGHKSLSMTRRYAHLRTEDQMPVKLALDKLLPPALAAGVPLVKEVTGGTQAQAIPAQVPATPPDIHEPPPASPPPSPPPATIEKPVPVLRLVPEREDAANPFPVRLDRLA